MQDGWGLLQTEKRCGLALHRIHHPHEADGAFAQADLTNTVVWYDEEWGVGGREVVRMGASRLSALRARDAVRSLCASSDHVLNSNATRFCPALILSKLRRRRRCRKLLQSLI